MSTLDLRTLMIGFLAGSVICCLVIVTLWLQYLRRYRGLGFYWLVLNRTPSRLA